MIENILLDRLVDVEKCIMIHSRRVGCEGVNATLCGGGLLKLYLYYTDSSIVRFMVRFRRGGYDGDAIEMNFSRPSSSDWVSARQ